MPSHNGPPYRVQYWKRPMGINDRNNVPISDKAAAQMRSAVTQRLSNLPAQLYRMAVGSTWERSPEQSMGEYHLLDLVAQSVDILKAMNIRDRDRMQEKASRRRKEQAPGVLKAIKYRVCPKEMQKTRNDMRELRERGCSAHCVEDCMREIIQGTNMRCTGTPNFVHAMRDMEFIMDEVRATAIKVKTDNPDHWAIEILNFYADGWIVWLDEINMYFQDSWYKKTFDEKMEGAKQRAKVAKEVVEEVKKERIPMPFGSDMRLSD